MRLALSTKMESSNAAKRYNEYNDQERRLYHARKAHEYRVRRPEQWQAVRQRYRLKLAQARLVRQPDSNETTRGNLGATAQCHDVGSISLEHVAV